PPSSTPPVTENSLNPTQTLIEKLRASADKPLKRLAPVAILEKNIWYVGDSMLHTAQWNSTHSMSTPPLKAIQIWAHITGVPLDLRHDEGLSLVAGLVGEPKDTDEFTRNLVSLTVCHVKVEVDLTVPLPKVVEFERESGVVVELSVHYPWVLLLARIVTSSVTSSETVSLSSQLPLTKIQLLRMSKLLLKKPKNSHKHPAQSLPKKLHKIPKIPPKIPKTPIHLLPLQRLLENFTKNTCLLLRIFL
ncbi:unnamed protein product, partial [Brassica rapa]